MGKKLKKADYSKIKKNIIKRLYSNQAFKKGHLLYERVAAGVPPHLKGCVKNVLDDLIKEGLVIHYGKTKHGDVYQLNVKRLKDIEEIIF